MLIWEITQPFCYSFMFAKIMYLILITLSDIKIKINKMLLQQLRTDKYIYN